jgi:hypothetical protein
MVTDATTAIAQSVFLPVSSLRGVKRISHVARRPWENLTSRQAGAHRLLPDF